MANTPCRYGLNCRNLLNGCKYAHNLSNLNNLNTLMSQLNFNNNNFNNSHCRYGSSCKHKCIDNINASGVLFVCGNDIVLGKEMHGKHVGEYDVLGGKCDGDDSITAACREVREESCGCYNVTPQQLANAKYVDIKSGSHFFRTYIINDNTISCTTFNNAIKSPTHKANIQRNHPKNWNSYYEMSGMCKFPISSLRQAYNTNQTISHQITGNSRTGTYTADVSSRAVSIINAALQQNIL